LIKNIYTGTFLEEWKKSINNNNEYARFGSTWNDPVLLKFDPLPEPLSIQNHTGYFLDLEEGKCKHLRFSITEDENKAGIIISGDENTWLGLLLEKRDPLFLIMKGDLKIEKGSLMKITSQRKSANALLKSAATIISNGTQKGKTMSTNNEISSGEFKPLQREYKTTANSGLDHDSFPMQLFQKSKKLGVWNPADIKFEKDREDWQSLNETEQTVLKHLTSLFMAGEEAVTLDLLPLIRIVAMEGRIEEEIYLTSFLWEEAKHTEFFSLFTSEVITLQPEFRQFHGPSYKKIFYELLPTSLQKLEKDPSPENQLRASFTYNMLVEGTLAETGYEAYHQMLEKNDLLPGLREGIGLLKKDESRHIAFGLYFLKRILDEYPHLKKILEDELPGAIDDVIELINELFEPYDPMPFGLQQDWFIEYAGKQFQARMEKLLN